MMDNPFSSLSEAPLKPQGGPAFPSDIAGWGSFGLSARDYFASAAMAGMFANGQRVSGEDPIAQRAQYAYAVADAMLKARDA